MDPELTIMHNATLCSFLSQSDNSSQEFLEGHGNRVSCLCLSKNGQYLATGQVGLLSFQL